MEVFLMPQDKKYEDSLMAKSGKRKKGHKHKFNICRVGWVAQRFNCVRNNCKNIRVYCKCGKEKP